MIRKNRHGKSQVSGFYVGFLHIDFYKLFLNLIVLALFGFLIWSAIQLFSSNFLGSPLIGSIVFFVEIIAFIFLCIHFRANSWRPPNIIITFLIIVVMAIVMAFAGVQPLSSYKEAVINHFNTLQQEQKQQAEQRKIEEQNRIAAEQLKTEATKTINSIKEAVNKAEELSKLEHDVVNLVNAIRVERKSPVLIWDDKLYSYSKSHSEEMAKQERLFHSPTGLAYAENCWGGEGSQSWNAKTIVTSWMGSDLHRTWLLCPNLKHIAVGIAFSDSGMYASWTFWVSETNYDTDWWYCNGSNKPPAWWY